MLRFIRRPETDPWFNLAAEEYLLRSASTDTFMTWRNDPSVIIGKHQNAAREINHQFVRDHQLPVIRRITGGGTVYHDPGNINYSFIHTQRNENLVNFLEFTRPVILFLGKLGLDAEFEGKSNITVSGQKVSGNSAHVYRNKVLHHGTLLFDSDLEILGKAVAGNEKSYFDKAVRSVRAKVANIKALLKDKLTLVEFNGRFTSFILSYHSDHYHDELTGEERKAIQLLAEKKYRSAEWNYSYSPDYEYIESWKYQGVDYSVSVSVKKGIITGCRIIGPEKDGFITEKISEVITGKLHEKNSITEILNKLIFADDRDKETVNQILDHLF